VIGGPPVRAQGERPDLSTVPAEFRFLFRQPGATDSGQQGDSRADHWIGLPYDSISLERSSCMIVCPAYTVTFFRGRNSPTFSPDDDYGRAELVATVPRGADFDRWTRLFPERTGRFAGRIDLFQFASLAYLIQKTGVARLPNRYESGWSDERTVTVTVTTGDQTTSVADEGGVGPIELWAVREAIDSVAKSIAWTPTRSR